MKGLAGIIGKLFSTLVLLLLFACDEDTVNPENGPNIRLLTSEEQFLIESSNHFAIGLLNDKELSDQNVFISPISVGAALGIIGNTVSEEEFIKYRSEIGLPQLPRIEINKAFYEVSNMLPHLDHDVTLDFHNSLWTRYNVSENNDFYTQVLAYYNADVQEIYPGKTIEQKHLNKWTQFNSNFLWDNIENFNYQSDFQIVNMGVFKGSFFGNDNSKYILSNFRDANGKIHEIKMNYFVNKKIGRINNTNGAKIYSIPISNANYVVEILEQSDENIPIRLEDKQSSFELITSNILIPDIKGSCELKLNQDFSKFEIDRYLERALENNFETKEDHGAKNYTFLNKNWIEITGTGNEFVSLIDGKEIPLNEDLIHINNPFYFFIKEKNSNLIIFEGKYNFPE